MKGITSGLLGVALLAVLSAVRARTQEVKLCGGDTSGNLDTL
jgi:hypothetical protein